MANNYFENNDAAKENDKVDDETKKNKKYPVVFIIIGILGIAATIVLLIYSYKESKNTADLIRPALLGFLPFAISFMFIKIGIKGLTERIK